MHVSARVCVCVIYVVCRMCIYIYVCVYLFIYLCIYLFICLFIYLCVCVGKNLCIQDHTSISLPFNAWKKHIHVIPGIHLYFARFKSHILIILHMYWMLSRKSVWSPRLISWELETIQQDHIEPYWTMLNQGSWLCSSSCESLQSRKASPHFLSDIAAAETLARFANLKAKKNMLRCIPQGKKHATASRAFMWNMWNHVTSNG